MIDFKIKRHQKAFFLFFIKFKLNICKHYLKNKNTPLGVFPSININLFFYKFFQALP